MGEDWGCGLEGKRCLWTIPVFVSGGNRFIRTLFGFHDANLKSCQLY